MEIKLENVGFSYKKINYIEREILKDINIKFQSGKINAIIGKNGSGKTTLLNLITGILEPTTGNVFINNEKYLETNINKIRFNVGYVHQDINNQFVCKTVKQELLFGLKFYNYRIIEEEKRVLDALFMIGLNDTYLSKRIIDLTEEEKRLVAIASVLIINPKIIIFDDPTVNLSNQSKERLIKLFRLLKRRYNKTIIIATNDIDFILKFVDYVYVLDSKKIVLENNKYEVFKNDNILKKSSLLQPKIIDFENTVYKRKKIKIGYRDEINDLIKDIYRYVK